MKSSHFPQIYTPFDYFKEKVIFTPLFWEIFGKPRENRYTEASGHTDLLSQNVYGELLLGYGLIVDIWR